MLIKNPSGQFFSHIHICLLIHQYTIYWKITTLFSKSVFTPEWAATSFKMEALHGHVTLGSMMTSLNGSIFRVTVPLCGEFTSRGDFPTQRPVTRSFGVFFDLRLNKLLSKQPWGWWFETPSWSLWRHCNVDCCDVCDVLLVWCIVGCIVWCMLWCRLMEGYAWVIHSAVMCYVIGRWKLCRGWMDKWWTYEWIDCWMVNDSQKHERLGGAEWLFIMSRQCFMWYLIFVFVACFCVLSGLFILWRINILMMTSSNGNIFRVTGPWWGEFTGHWWFPSQRPVTRSFGVFFDLRLNKRLSKQLRRRWFETPPRSL